MPTYGNVYHCNTKNSSVNDLLSTVVIQQLQRNYICSLTLKYILVAVIMVFTLNLGYLVSMSVTS